MRVTIVGWDPFQTGLIETICIPIHVRIHVMLVLGGVVLVPTECTMSVMIHDQMDR